MGIRGVLGMGRSNLVFLLNLLKDRRSLDIHNQALGICLFVCLSLTLLPVLAFAEALFYS